MKNATIIAITFLLFSCNSTETDFKKQIILFENHIGLENANGLTKLTSEFERFLNNMYPNETVDSAYTFFLRAVKSDYLSYQDIGINKDWEKRFQKIKEQTNLENELYLFVDSVWYEKKEVKYSSSYYGKDTISSESGAIIMMAGDTKDSILMYMEFLRNSKSYHTFGKYHTGLDLIKGQDSVIIRYLDAKRSAGGISPSLFASGYLYSKPNFRNYFHKRIYLVELFY